MEQKTVILVGASLLMLIFSFGCLIQTQQPSTNQNSPITIKTLLDKPTATECVIIQQVSKNNSLYFDMITVPHKYVFIKSHMIDKQGKTLQSAFTSTIILDVPHRIQYTRLPSMGPSFGVCKNAPRTCYWIQKNYTERGFNYIITRPLGVGKQTIQCKEITNPPKFPVNPQEACSMVQISRNIGYCIAKTNMTQTIYNTTWNNISKKTKPVNTPWS